MSNAVDTKEFHLGHRPALDGFRGAAVAIVVIVHSHMLTHVHLLNTSFGNLGVVLFFVLSGFLITSLLVEEWDQSGSISLKSFYARRALRLLPALLALLLAFLVYSFIAAPAELHDRIVEILAALFYFTNWDHALLWHNPGLLQHTWSLSIEEQFYMLWPALLLILLKRMPSRGALMRLVFLGALLSWLLRNLLFGELIDVSFSRVLNGLDTRADSLLMGCGLAIAFSANGAPDSPRWKSGLRMASSVSIVGLALVGSLFSWSAPIMPQLNWFLMSLFATLIIADLIVSPESRLAHFLRLPFMVYLGRISYGLYLWHFPIFAIIEQLHWPEWKATIVAVPLTTAITLASYYLLEKPCLRFKKRFERAR